MQDPLADVRVSRRRAVTITVLGAAALAVLAIARPSVVGTIAVVVAFFTMILLHELGHFVMAKRAGMKCTEFFLGFGPRLWSVQRGETEYGVKAFPLGGYVKIIGMTNLDEVPPEDEERTYRAKGYWSKLSVAVAGSAMHFIIATVLMFGLLAMYGEFRPSEITRTATIGEVSEGSPAEAAGLRAGDEIVAIDGTPVEDWADIPDLVQENGTEPLELTYLRGDAEQTVSVTPERVEEGGQEFVRVGVAWSGDIVRPDYSVPEALVMAPVRTVDLGVESVKALGRIFSPSGIASYFETLSGENPDSQDRFLSPVGFGRVANQAVNSGLADVLLLLIAINVFVGIFNLVPLLPFDGGHIAVATYEAIASKVKRRKVQVDVAKLMPITVVVIGILGFIFVTSMFLDIANPIPNPY